MRRHCALRNTIPRISMAQQRQKTTSGDYMASTDTLINAFHNVARHGRPARSCSAFHRANSRHEPSGAQASGVARLADRVLHLGCLLPCSAPAYSAFSAFPSAPSASPAACCSSGSPSKWYSRSGRTGKKRPQETAITEDHIQNIAVFPLALPLIAGPGAISATILLAGSLQTTFDRAQLISSSPSISDWSSPPWRFRTELDRMLGSTGRAILTRLLGVILAALAAQFVVDGARAALKLA